MIEAETRSEDHAMTSAAVPTLQFPDGKFDVIRVPARRRLLVIEDDLTPRTVIARLAQRLGYATTEASTFEQAAALIAAETFDCMTLDLHMGEHYGTELLEAMSRSQTGVPVIVISSADDDERWDVLRVATLYGIRVTEVAKPLDVGELRAVFAAIGDLA
jgi:two-component system, chemotaxis family, chemotaxis protein CheY